MLLHPHPEAVTMNGVLQARQATAVHSAQLDQVLVQSVQVLGAVKT